MQSNGIIPAHKDRHYLGCWYDGSRLHELRDPAEIAKYTMSDSQLDFTANFITSRGLPAMVYHVFSMVEYGRHYQAYIDRSGGSPKGYVRFVIYGQPEEWLQSGRLDVQKMIQSGELRALSLKHRVRATTTGGQALYPLEMSLVGQGCRPGTSDFVVVAGKKEVGVDGSVEELTEIEMVVDNIQFQEIEPEKGVVVAAGKGEEKEERKEEETEKIDVEAGKKKEGEVVQQKEKEKEGEEIPPVGEVAAAPVVVHTPPPFAPPAAHLPPIQPRVSHKGTILYYRANMTEVAAGQPPATTTTSTTEENVVLTGQEWKDLSGKVEEYMAWKKVQAQAPPPATTTTTVAAGAGSVLQDVAAGKPESSGIEQLALAALDGIPSLSDTMKRDVASYFSKPASAKEAFALGVFLNSIGTIVEVAAGKPRRPDPRVTSLLEKTRQLETTAAAAAAAVPAPEAGEDVAAGRAPAPKRPRTAMEEREQLRKDMFNTLLEDAVNRRGANGTM